MQPQSPPRELCEDAAGTFAMLASPVRVELLWVLARQECDVGTLADLAGVALATTSQHLARLRLAGLVTLRREGKRHVYVVDDPHVVSLVEQAIDHHDDLRRRAAGQVPAGAKEARA